MNLKLVALLATASAFAQSPPAASAGFESADVHVTAPGPNQSFRGGLFPGQTVELRGATMLDLIRTAWNVNADTVYGGPPWLDLDRFDVLARTTASSTTAQQATMLRALLEDRFKLATHNGEKLVDVFALTADKPEGHLTKSEGEGDSGCRQTGGEQGPPLMIVTTCQNTTMDLLADQLPEIAGVAWLDRPVADLTALKGAWNFSFKWTPRARLITPSPAGGDAEPIRGISLFDAFRQQLGLKLEQQKHSMPVIVVDRVNRVPTENLSRTAKAVPAATKAFEVATIKPSGPASPGRTTRSDSPAGFLPGGRVELRNISLKALIALAWEVDTNMIAGGPKWVDSDRFEVIAKAATPSPGEAPSIDDVRIMLRTLLQERFMLTVHQEDLPTPVYLLTVSAKGSKLKEADPATRIGCRYSYGETGGGPAPVPLFTQTCQNLTMSQLAQRLPAFAPGYIDHPVVDLTGLNGSYDFAVNWVSKGRALGGSSDLSGGHTIFESIDKLGLKLQEGKHPLPGIVIDRAEHIAGDN